MPRSLDLLVTNLLDWNLKSDEINMIDDELEVLRSHLKKENTDRGKLTLSSFIHLRTEF